MKKDVDDPKDNKLYKMNHVVGKVISYDVEYLTNKPAIRD